MAAVPPIAPRAFVLFFMACCGCVHFSMGRFRSRNMPAEKPTTWNASPAGTK